MAWYDIPLRSINIVDILEGCTMSMLDQIGLVKDQQLIEIAAYRQRICDNCLQNENGWCVSDTNKKLVKHKETGEMVTGCGCQINCKKFILHVECPAKLWKSVVIS